MPPPTASLDRLLPGSGLGQCVPGHLADDEIAHPVDPPAPKCL